MKILESVLCYSDGNYPPSDIDEVPPDDYIDSGRLEIYDFRVVDEFPVAGQEFEYPEGKMKVVEVREYIPKQACHLSYAVAICTIDGSTPERNDYYDPEDDSGVRYLLIDGDQIVERAPDLADWALAAGMWAVPNPPGSTRYVFEPTEPYPLSCTVAVVDVARATVAA